MLAVRKETIADIPSIRTVVEVAFGRPNEADLVDALRQANALTLSAVAVLDGRIIGHLAFSPVSIQSNGAAFDAIALAPVAVLPKYQRQGVGTKLIRWGLDECRRLGHGVVIVLGDPKYYSRFGFATAATYGIQCPFPVPTEVFMVAELTSGILDGRTGVVKYRQEFELV